MPGTLWVVGEASPDGRLARISAEVATLARGLAAAAGLEPAGIAVAPPAAVAGIAEELASYLPRVVAVPAPAMDASPAAVVVAAAVAELLTSDGAGQDVSLLVGASPDGRDTAGFLAAMLGTGVLANAAAVTWDGGPVIEKGVFGGRAITTSELAAGHGIVTVALGSVPAEATAEAGRVEMREPATPGASAGGLPVAPAVTVLERVEESAGAVQIEEARIIVSGGRGMGSAEGFAVADELAAELGGAVAASRAAVDAGWIPYSRQVGQTGKIVKPDVYIALGISGAVQHKVGMQGAHTIVAINTDPDAPIAEFADMLVIGNLFEIVPAVVAELRARRA